jgi:hypothetical protein
MPRFSDIDHGSYGRPLAAIDRHLLHIRNHGGTAEGCQPTLRNERKRFEVDGL